jgi:hypothetical protein
LEEKDPIVLQTIKEINFQQEKEEVNNKFKQMAKHFISPKKNFTSVILNKLHYSLNKKISTKFVLKINDNNQISKIEDKELEYIYEKGLNEEQIELIKKVLIENNIAKEVDEETM